MLHMTVGPSESLHISAENAGHRAVLWIFMIFPYGPVFLGYSKNTRQCLSIRNPSWPSLPSDGHLRSQQGLLLCPLLAHIFHDFRQIELSLGGAVTIIKDYIIRSQSLASNPTTMVLCVLYIYIYYRSSPGGRWPSSPIPSQPRSPKLRRPRSSRQQSKPSCFPPSRAGSPPRPFT